MGIAIEMEGSTGPISDDLRRDLEALKLRLAGMSGADLPVADAQSVGNEISAIRLQLKRLKLEQEEVAEAVRRSARPPQA